MTAERFVLGQVFRYPYKWSHAQNVEEPKERPACLVFRIENISGGAKLAIVAISDQPPREPGLGIEVPASEIARAGLSPHRAAFVHLGEVNIDRLENSYSFNSRARTLGRFSKPFLSRLGKQLAANIKDKRIVTIIRGE